MTTNATGWFRARAAKAVRALPFLIVEAGASFVSLLFGFLVLILLLFLGPGWLALPDTDWMLRAWANRMRRRAGAYSGREIGSSYPPLEGSWFARAQTVLRDRSTYRDLLWLVGHGLPGLVIGLLAIALPLSVLSTFSIPAYWWALPEDEPAAAVFEVTSWPLAFATVGVGVVYAVLTIVLLPLFASLQVWWAKVLLRPGKKERLSQRVSELTASRASALEAHGAELRRIERDLHDGTQNKLVGVVMHLGIVERSLGREPDQVRPVLLKAQDAAETALAELRDVVRSIYPPVLDEHGLDGALASVVARCPVDTTLSTDGLRRAPIAVESAAYFVVSEALTNIARHSHAQHAGVRIGTEYDGGERVMIEVRDDGVGGAGEDGGTGLPGIRRRVESFEGVFRVESPDGGPTTLWVEIPCGS